MNYGVFRRRVNGYLQKAGIQTKVEFSYDKDKILYSARIPEHNMVILGNPSGLSLTVRFGSGHQAMVPV